MTPISFHKYTRFPKIIKVLMGFSIKDSIKDNSTYMVSDKMANECTFTGKGVPVTRYYVAEDHF